MADFTLSHSEERVAEEQSEVAAQWDEMARREKVCVVRESSVLAMEDRLNEQQSALEVTCWQKILECTEMVS